MRLGQQRGGLRDRLVECRERGIRQIGEIARLVDERCRLVLQHLEFVVDLLQLVYRGQHILRVIGGIEDDPAGG